MPIANSSIQYKTNEITNHHNQFYRPKIEVFPEQYDYYGNRKQTKRLMYPNDIVGAQSMTKYQHTFSKPKLDTQTRNLTPIEPNYRYIGGDSYETIKSKHY